MIFVSTKSIGRNECSPLEVTIVEASSANPQ